MSRMYVERPNRNSFNGINAGSPSTIALPADRGAIIEANLLYTEGGVAVPRNVLEQAVPEVELLINGDRFGLYKTKDLFFLDDFYGEEAITGELPFRFAQNIRRTIQEVEATAFIPAAYRNPEMVYHIADGRVAPRLEQTLISEGVGQAGRNALAQEPARGARQTIHHYTKTIDILNSGPATPNDYRYEGGGERIRALHFFGANITAIKVLINEQERWIYNSKEHLDRRLVQKGMVPQADVWSLAFEGLGGSLDAAFRNSFGGVPQVLDFEIYTSNEDNVRVLGELYSVPQGVA